MTKEAILELRACAAMQLLCKEDKMKLFSSASAPSQVSFTSAVGLFYFWYHRWPGERERAPSLPFCRSRALSFQLSASSSTLFCRLSLL
jgi:hypothetical protein